jgi:predicted DCC family thiol-disulfide oxidoreductase YuxK
LSSRPPVLLYDGYCALCNGWVKFLLRFDRHGTLRFAALTGDTGRQLVAEHPDLAGIDSLVLVSGDRVSVRSAAVLQILAYLGWPWRAAGIFRIVPREIRDSLYDVVAYWRYRLFGRYEACPLPPADQRHRFLP